MMNETEMVISPPVGLAEEDWVEKLWQSEWGGEMMISRGKTHFLSDLDCLVARDNQELLGVATYCVDLDGCELVSINATKSGKGVGTQLLQAVENAARLAASEKVWLVTSNDNVDAMKFYQRHGYRMTKIHCGAIDKARLQKERIPLVGNFGIEIHDEIELVKYFKDR